MVYIQVALDLGGALGDCLTYSTDNEPAPPIGAFVFAPVRGRRALGIVLGEALVPQFKTRSILGVASPVTVPAAYVQLATWIAEHYRAPLFECLRLCFPPGLESRAVKGAANRLEWPPGGSTPDVAPGRSPAVQLSRDQDEARRSIVQSLRSRRPDVFLLHGVTGSGKTHVFLEAAAEALRRQEQVVILVSDISLTPEALARIERRFPGQVGIAHSSIAEGARARTWRAIHDGTISIVVGTRSALFAPAHRLGLIVIDEEHEPTYKQDAPPRYHARDVAVQLGRLARAPLVLSSATPDVASYYRAEQGQYRILTLPERITGMSQGRRLRSSLPVVEIVDMRRELRAGFSGLLSRSLKDQVERTLADGLQVMLFLNRRGSASALTCRACGDAVSCRRCSVPMGFHEARALLICHRCGRKRDIPEACPGCGDARLAPMGAGVQRVESEARRAFPTARVVRWDKDTTSSRGAHRELWRSFAAHEADILVGTQMIGKGLDFPDVGLVGIVLAESQLYLPDYRAAERTFEILTQVAGRAGRRGEQPGRVVLQTFVPEHYAIQAAARHDYLDLYRREIAFRRQQAYPPFRRLIKLVYSAGSEQAAETEATRVRDCLVDEVQRLGLSDLQVIGPAPSFVSRLRGRYRWQMVIAGDDGNRALDAVSLNPGWQVDVDPMDTL